MRAESANLNHCAVLFKPHRRQLVLYYITDDVVLASIILHLSEKFVEFERQIEREKGRLKGLEESCTCLKDCIIFDNGAIDTRMMAARNAWNIFAEKFKTRRVLLAVMKSDIVPVLDKVRFLYRFFCDV